MIPQESARARSVELDATKCHRRDERGRSLVFADKVVYRIVLASVARGAERRFHAVRAEENAMTGTLVIDCDGHILEPPDLWETYLEPAYRDRALRIRVGDDGFEQLLIDGRPSTMARPGQLATLGGMGQRVEEARELRERAMRGEVAPEKVRGLRATPEETYLKGAAFGTMDMKERVQLLDREGMAKAVLYPTLGLLWEAELFDAALSSAYCRAYNR
jgi:hypothetical protein